MIYHRSNFMIESNCELSFGKHTSMKNLDEICVCYIEVVISAWRKKKKYIWQLYPVENENTNWNTQQMVFIFFFVGGISYDYSHITDQHKHQNA